MRKLKNRIYYFICGIILTGLLTACGSTYDESSFGNPDEETIKEETASTEAETEDISSKEETEPEEEEEEEAEPETYYEAVFPTKKGNIPTGEEFPELLQGLSEELEMNEITEIIYTWENGVPSMELRDAAYERDPELDGKVKGKIEKIYDPDGYYSYALYLPDGYEQNDPSKKWPLILFLHSSGEVSVGEPDLDLLIDRDLFGYISCGGEVNAVVVAPQQTEMGDWTMKLQMFLPEIMEKYNVDTDRVYLVGSSMGARGAWELGLSKSDVFAALVAVGGEVDYQRSFERLTDTSVWILNGSEDQSHPINYLNQVLPVLKKTGLPNYRVTIFMGADHNDIWEAAYFRPDIYDWMLQQKKHGN